MYHGHRFAGPLGTNEKREAVRFKLFFGKFSLQEVNEDPARQVKPFPANLQLPEDPNTEPERINLVADAKIDSKIVEKYSLLEQKKLVTMYLPATLVRLLSERDTVVVGK